MTVASLEAAFDALGVPCSVEAHDRLAVIIPRGDPALLEDARVRREALRLAREHGFTHIALDLAGPAPAWNGNSGGGASPMPPRASLHRD